MLGFWQRVDTYEEQPDIHFEHELLILLETADADNTFGWSTFPNFNALLDDKIRTPKIQVRPLPEFNITFCLLLLQKK